MFRDFKGGGYNLERTNLTGDRLSKLLILLSLAYLKSIIQGVSIKSKQVQEYLGKKKQKVAENMLYIALSILDYGVNHGSIQYLVIGRLLLN
jgi:hypothetical protein